MAGILTDKLYATRTETVAFLARPARWLRAISAHRGTISAAPNFAYEICASRIDGRELAGLDLSSWRWAFNGAEAVSADTLESHGKFRAKFDLNFPLLADVDQKVAEMRRRFGEGQVPLPDFWGGYRVEPDEIELWQGRDSRLHDRFRYRRGPEGGWKVARLAP